MEEILAIIIMIFFVITVRFIIDMYFEIRYLISNIKSLKRPPPSNYEYEIRYHGIKMWR